MTGQRSVLILLFAVFCSLWLSTRAFVIPTRRSNVALSKLNVRFSSTKEKTESTTTSPQETTEKYGLEAGLFQSLKSKDAESAKSLLKKYGIAYLATSIPLAILSFTFFYILVDNGVDVGALLSKVGIDESNLVAEKTGTFAIAYAAHKAASPIRFPPTVLLTPLVAKLIGKEPQPDNEEEA